MGGVIERAVLERTNLAGAYDFWQAVMLYGGILTAIVGIIAAIAAWQVNYAIPNSAAAESEKLDAKIMQEPVSAWPARLLVKDGWVEVPSERAQEQNLKILARHAINESARTQTTSLVIKRGEQTMAWAEAMAFGEHYVWPFASVDDSLEDGTNLISLKTAISRTRLAEFLRETGGNPVDVVGVGLESSAGGDPADVFRELSDDRGSNLVQAAQENITVVHPDKAVTFRALGLGRAMSSAQRNSDIERRQRSALIVAVARMSHDTVMLSLGDALTRMIMDVRLSGINLQEYEYAPVATRRLSPPLTFDGSAEDYWRAPQIPISEANALRARAE